MLRLVMFISTTDASFPVGKHVPPLRLPNLPMLPRAYVHALSGHGHPIMHLFRSRNPIRYNNRKGSCPCPAHAPPIPFPPHY